MKNLLKHWATIGLLTLGVTACGIENRELTPKQIAEGNKPGTVWIEAIHKAEIAVPDYTIDQDKLRQLKQTLINQARRGNITSKEQAIAALLQEMLANPLQYLQPTDEIIRKSAEVTSTGTGSLITEDGYIVTNAHVVSSEGEDLKRELAKSALQDVAIASCRDIMGDLSGDQTEAAIRQVIGTQEFKQLCLEGMIRYFAHYMKLSQPETKVYTAIGAVAPNEDLSKQGYLSEVKAMGKPTPGKDVAILKINQQNLPTVILGDDKSLETGDRIYILGYPAAAITNNSKDNAASLTAGLVSARKTMPDDWEVLQTDAAMSSGNSGGPVFNDQGKMIGIATFGIVDPDSGASVQGANFVVPVSIVQEFLQSSNVQPQESRLSQQYREGIRLFEAKHYGRALEVFRKINELNAQFPYVQEYISNSRREIDAGHDQAVPVWLYGAIPGGLVLVGVGAWQVKRYRRATKLKPLHAEQVVSLPSSVEPGQR